MTERIAAIDAVVNLWTPEALALRPAGREAFYQDKMRVSGETDAGLSLDAMRELLLPFDELVELEVYSN